MHPVSIIIPCFNEREAIEKTIHDLFEAVGAEAEVELIVVNDGSTDGSKEILEQLIESRTYPQLRVLHHTKNRGYGASLKTAFRASSLDWIFITDSDGTYPHSRAKSLIEEAQSRDLDMLVGSRTGENVTYSKIRSIPKFFLRRWVAWIVERPVPDMNSGMRVMRKSTLMRYIKYLPDGFSLTTTITIAMMRGGYDVDYSKVDYSRRVGNSKIQPFQDTIRFSQLILRTGLYFAPLKVFLPLAYFLFSLAMLSAFWDVFVLHNLTDKTVLLFLFSLNVVMFAGIADMIEKRIS